MLGSGFLSLTIFGDNMSCLAPDLDSKWIYMCCQHSYMLTMGSANNGKLWVIDHAR